MILHDIKFIQVSQDMPNQGLDRHRPFWQLYLNIEFLPATVDLTMGLVIFLVML